MGPRNGLLSLDQFSVTKTVLRHGTDVFGVTKAKNEVLFKRAREWGEKGKICQGDEGKFYDLGHPGDINARGIAC
jgi:hypothetical protein